MDGFILNRNRLECGLFPESRFTRKYQATPTLIDRLGLETTLEGHRGCVNCLQWNEDGSFLASGSDDCSVILWDAHNFKNRLTLATGHVGNIFSVKFLYKTNFIVTGAGDSIIRVHDIEKKETLHIFNCHAGRVKRLETIPTEPFVFWSASEDGTVRQFDIRCSNNSPSTASPNVLVDLTGHIGSHAEAKCLAMNPTLPSMLAVGANDAFIRLYDRRKLSLRQSFSQCVQNETASQPTGQTKAIRTPDQMHYGSTRYLVPGHVLRQNYFNRRRGVNATYISFSQDGRELLANLGGEQIYAFSTSIDPASGLCRRQPLNYSTTPTADYNLPDSTLFSLSGFPTQNSNQCTPSGISKYGDDNDDVLAYLDEEVSLAHRLLSKKAFPACVEAYNRAIALWPNQAKLYTDRAVALIKRCWDGDMYASLRNCCMALELMKSKECNAKKPSAAILTTQLLTVRCLLYLGWIRAARSALEAVRPFCPVLPRTVPIAMAKEKKTIKDIGRIFDQLDQETKEMEAICIKRTLQQTDSTEAVDLLPDWNEGKVKSGDASRHESSASSTTSSDSVSSSNTSSSKTTTNDESVDTVQSAGRPESCRCVECLSTKADALLLASCTHFFERRWRQEAGDYEARFLGHCNGTTDIKEASFFGGDGQYVAAGSDCGCMFIWERATSNIVRVLQADSATVNCVQPHPTSCLIATSGIESVVRIWSPQPEGVLEELLVTNHLKAAKMNQSRLRANPLEMMARQMAYYNSLNSNRHPFGNDDDDDVEEEEVEGHEKESEDDEIFDDLPVVPGAALDSVVELSSNDTGLVLLDPEIAATALLSPPPQIERENEYDANQRRVMARIVLGLPSDSVDGAGATNFFFRTFRDRTGAATSTGVPHQGNDNHHPHGNGESESGDDMDQDESSNVLELPCTTS